MSDMTRAALWYAQRGWHVFPCHGVANGRCTCGDPHCTRPGKHPRTRHGLTDATTTPKQIMESFARPGGNVAISCGPSCLVVVDVDPRHGGTESLKSLMAEAPDSMGTMTAHTGGGGIHLYYSAPQGMTIRSGVNKLGVGIDIRATGGYVLAAPSRHASGGLYQWKPGYGPHERALAPLPTLLAERLITRATTAPHPVARPPEDWRRLVVEGAAEGSRHDALVRLVGHLLRRGVDPWVALGLAFSWNRDRCIPPLETDEVTLAVNAIAKAELRRRGGARSAR